MSLTQKLLEKAAADAGMSLYQYFDEVEKWRKMDQEESEWAYWKSIEDRSYFTHDGVDYRYADKEGK